MWCVCVGSFLSFFPAPPTAVHPSSHPWSVPPRVRPLRSPTDRADLTVVGWSVGRAGGSAAERAATRTCRRHFAVGNDTSCRRQCSRTVVPSSMRRHLAAGSRHRVGGQRSQKAVPSSMPTALCSRERYIVSAAVQQNGRALEHATAPCSGRPPHRSPRLPTESQERAPSGLPNKTTDSLWAAPCRAPSLATNRSPQ